MSRHTITIISFVVAIILTALGSHYCWNHKVIPLVRLALWFPFPYLLRANEVPGLLLSVIQFPVLASVFSLAIRRWRARWVLAVFVLAYALYAAVVIAILGPPR
jgi:hypothetical protein